MPINWGRLNPFVNRLAEPAELIDTIAGEIGIGYLQLVHEFINPAWPDRPCAVSPARWPRRARAAA